jgi:hypothetical protein
MAEIEIGPLSERLSDEELKELHAKLERLGAPRLGPEADGDATVVASVDGDVLVEFLDRLDAYDLACEIYLPSEFEGRVEVGEYRVGSTPALVEVLEEMKDEMDEEEEEEDAEAEDVEDDDDDDEDAYANMKILEQKVRRLWKVLYDGAQVALDRRLPLYVLSD